jgi:sulfate/thiosulfate transport system permease protein
MSAGQAAALHPAPTAGTARTAATPRASRRSRPVALAGFGLTLGVTLLFVSLVLLLPLSALVLKAAGLGWAEFWAHATDPRALAAYRVTLTAACMATALNVVLGLSTAWLLERYEFPGRRLLDAMVDIPFALPTAVAGIALSAVTVANGWVGQWVAPLGWQIAYAFPGIVLAMAFTSFPFVVRTLQPVIAQMGPEPEEAARSLGAGRATAFWRVVLPTLRPALLAGGTLAFVRSLGEFGAIVFIAGNLPFRTEIAALLVFIRVGEFDYPAAAVLATVILGFALAVLVSMNLLQARWLRRVHPA